MGREAVKWTLPKKRGQETKSYLVIEDSELENEEINK